MISQPQTMSISLATRDSRLVQLTTAISNKRMFIIKKKRELDKQSDDNIFLIQVRNNYIKFYNHIVEEKRNQLKAMTLLHQYLEELKHTNALLSHEMNTASHDHTQIMKEISIIKEELDTIS
jgi:FtsZ-binding cell division protein ZapB